MNYNHLFYFWNIAKEGSIKKASAILNVTQPTLSDQLKTLEENIGTKLFDRIGKRLVLNERGQMVYHYTNRMFRIGAEMAESIQNKTYQQVRYFHIGFVPTIAKGRIYQILSPFFENTENRIKVIEGEADLLIRQFESGDLDMIICERPIFNLGQSVKLFKLVESKFYVVVAPKYEQAAKGFPQSLSEIPFINYTQESDIQNQILGYFHKNNITPPIIGEMDDVNIIRLFTINGHCFSILPKTVITESLKNKRLITLSPMPDIKISIYGIVKNAPRNKIIFDILETIN